MGMDGVKKAWMDRCISEGKDQACARIYDEQCDKRLAIGYPLRYVNVAKAYFFK